MTPTHKYTQLTRHISRDVFGRTYSDVYSDSTISYNTGKFIKLKVQATDDVRHGKGGSTWKRKKIKNVGPTPLKVSNWVFGHLDDVNKPINEYSFGDIAQIVGRTIAITPLMLFLNFAVNPGGGEVRNGGNYDPVPYRYFGRAKTSRNPMDDNVNQHPLGKQTQFQKTITERPVIFATPNSEQTPRAAMDRTERILLPRRLCWLETKPQAVVQDGGEYQVYQSTDVKQWMKQNTEHCPEYLFIAWRVSQFNTDSFEDREVLHELARRATKEAGLSCYWLSENCFSTSEEELSLDVWRMSDIVRGSSGMAVVLGKLPDEDNSAPQQHDGNKDPCYALLSSWSQSIWTFPELLLSKGSTITCYYLSEGEEEPMSPDIADLYHDSPASQYGTIRKQVIPKNQFAARCLEASRDRYQARRLIDHYSGNLKLSDLELTTVALECFSSRQAGSQYLPGDYSYALMGLLGRRPPVHRSDSAFLAFARLSLENYNNRLFERMLCLLQGEEQFWYDTSDVYGARLWDIEPSVQVAGIGVYNEQEAGMDAMGKHEFDQEFFHQDDGGATSQKILPPSPLPQPRHQYSPKTYSPSVVSQSQTHLTSRSQASFHSQAALNPPPITSHSVYNPSLQKSWSPTVTEMTELSSPSTKQQQQPEYSHAHLNPQTDTIILDGCLAATVHWSEFCTPFTTSYPALFRRILKWLLRVNLIPLLIGTILALIPWPSVSAFGGFLLFYSLTVLVFSPFIIRVLYGGKFWGVQPFFFGFEGYMSVGEIERKIWGADMGRLKWSWYASSPLSVHKIEEEGRYIVSEDPTVVEETRRLVEEAKRAGPGDMRVFTLVDTYSMTATLFQARRPPEALLICGSEGGMQRALGCSFEWTTQTFYKETVLRLETRVLDKMDRIRRVRLGIKRGQMEVMPKAVV
ncbi:putative 3-hydroxyisobutyrate dehydrogenase [Triangularia setosa]|uniref:3-hydroxyisobutyrate dehydrogenase n=1 Tax=Triangularia setosa TaxID=2587417 RepID=A0AAN7AAK5_9PEZI|nr:putative 3-hydroxyisobutyrate dehydrogenase [Podospora setosa]